MDLIILLSVASFCIGMLVNELHHIIVSGKGTLKINHSTDKDSYLFEIDDLDQLDKKKHVTLRIVHTHNISQK